MKTPLYSLAAALMLSAGSSHAQTELRVWDTFADTGQDNGMKALIAEFEKANPDITIARDVQNIDELRPVIQTALASGTGPDVFYYDTGPGFAGVLADNGLLMPLDDVYASGALDHIYPWTLERVTFGDKVYGIGNEVEFLGVYYNKDMFAELGIEVPTSYKDFLAAAATLKEAGRVPVSFGDSDGWPAFHLFSLYANNIAGKDKLDELLFNGGSWEDPAIVESIQAFFVDMNEKGYLLPSTTAINYDDSVNYFNSGQAGMMITGTWLIGNVTDNSTFDPGWFFLPKVDGGDPLPPAGLGSGYFVSSATEHADAATKFLTFLFDKANAKTWVEQIAVIPPYEVDPAGVSVTPLLENAMEALATVPMGYNIDVLTPDKFNTAMSDGFQAVLLGSKTPAEQAADLEAAMAQSRDK